MRSPLRVFVAALALAPALALSHALLQKTEPGRRAVLGQAPAQVRLWFNEKLEPAFSSIAVTDARGAPVTQDKARVAADNPKLLVLDLPPLGPGEYAVSYQVLSVDGHTVRANYRFTVKGPPGAR
jgi:methionine-rich copper-binding protein CopC